VKTGTAVKTISEFSIEGDNPLDAFEDFADLANAASERQTRWPVVIALFIVLVIVIVTGALLSQM
jgi:hypothetical protein